MSERNRAFVDDLKLNAAAVRLASAIYYAKAEAFGTHGGLWDNLDVMTRHTYTQRAAELLKTLQPRPVVFATGLRTETSNIVGAIGTL